MKKIIFVFLSIFIVIPVEAQSLAKYKEAVSLIAGKGNADSQCKMGEMYYNKGNSKEAMIWFRKAAAQHHHKSENWLGIMHEFGLGVEKNNVEAVNWFRKAANGGYVSGQYNLGTMYERGKGVPKNTQEAIKWYRKAAAQGHAQAKSKLSSLQENANAKSKLSSAKRNNNTQSKPGLLYSGYYTFDGHSMDFSSGQERYANAASHRVEIYDALLVVDNIKYSLTKRLDDGSRKFEVSVWGDEVWGTTRESLIVDKSYNIKQESWHYISMPYGGSSSQTFVGYWKKGTTAPSSATCNINNSTTRSNNPQSIQHNNQKSTYSNPVQPHRVVKDCYLCHGSGKCASCNGTRLIKYKFGSGYLRCTNCSDGNCKACGGNGKITTTKMMR